MNGNPDLDRERLTSLFDDLSRELEFARTRVQIYVIGGAAMSMAFSRDRTTRDVDARIDAGHGALMKAVEKIARKRGLTRNWLNEEATSAIPRESDRKPMKARAVEGLERVSRELKTESRGRPSSRVDRARPSE